MPSKELIALAANAMEERRKELIAQPLSRIYPQLAEAAAVAILAALQEPTEIMLQAYWDGSEASDSWGLMLAASVLGEQSYRAEIISADGAVWDETAPGTRNFKRREQSE